MTKGGDVLADFDLKHNQMKCDPHILLDGGPPRALYGVNPRLIFGKEWWDNARSWAYAKYNNHCAACAKAKCKLEAHEMYEVDSKKGKVTVKDIVPLCLDCHSFIHQDLHKALLKQGRLKYSDVVRILAHGKTVLKKAGIRNIRKDPNKGTIKREDWRLVLNGVEYPPVQGVKDVAT